MLEELPGIRARVFVVWEPVLTTDWAAPSSGTLARVHDARSAQFWDKEWLLSKTLGGPRHLPRSDGVNKIGFDMGDVIWDFIAIYPPRSDRPSFTGAPVYQVVKDIRRELATAPRR